MRKRFVSTLIILFICTCALFSQNFQPTPNDTLTSVIVHPDKSITFKIYAPDAKNVSLGGTDIPNLFQTGKMTKGDDGVWEITVPPVEPGAYRYNFNVDGVAVIDPRRPDISQSNMNVWVLVYVPGADFMEIKNVPHGEISEVTYYSKTLKRFRRMHVYTPPGYQNNDNHYPVFYLLHGAFDCDDSWHSVGRAGFIMDNLIAENKVVPMIIVMPAGHTGPFRFGMPLKKGDEFIDDFNNDIKLYIEKNYRTLNDRENRAIAGLSMGGAQTLNISIPHLNEYGYIGVFSSGIFGIRGGNSFGSDMGQNWEEENKATLDDDKLKEGLKLVWFATGKADFLLQTSRATVEMLKKHKFNVTFKESEGGHTWNNWRDYLYEFAQLLFK